MKKKLVLFSRQEITKVHFQVVSKLGKQVMTTKGYWSIISNIKHPTLKNKEEEVKETLKNPDYVRQSENNKKVCLFYKKYKKRYLSVVTRHLNGSGFIITAYFTSKIKEGKQIWPKK